MDVQIAKEIVEAEIGSAKKSLVKEIDEQYKIWFDIESVGFEERNANLIKEETEKLLTFCGNEIKKVQVELSKKWNY